MTVLNKREFLVYSASAAAALAAGGALSSPSSAKTKELSAMQLPPVLVKADDLPEADVINWLKALRGHPYVAQSGFDVTSVFKVKTPDGFYYVGGVNVENRDLITGTCGEEGAIAAAIGAFGQDIDIVEGWVMGAPKGAETSDIPCYPCGECRQRIAQYTAPNAPVHVIALNGEHKDTKTRAELLPNAFSFRDLEHTGEAAAVPALAAVSDVTQRLYQQPKEPLTTVQVFDWLRGLRGDVRVSGYNEMTLWRLANGAYVAGVKIENAAYPSSTNVMSAAASVMNAHFGKQKVVEVWVHGFHNDATKSTAGHYVPSGAALQVLHQFATPTTTLHQFNKDGMAKSVTIGELLKTAPVFS